ncbi:MAG: P-loop NTPase fold protein, partial [Actinomycetota bacterium]
LWLLLTVLLVSLVFGYFWFHPTSGRWLIALVPKDPKELWEEIGKTTLLGGGLLAALTPPLVGLYNAVRAFGLEPKRLLGSLAVDGGGAVKAEPGVRYRFAAEFADVTKALKPQTLVIFIDDLDRCTQEHVLEVLECINFLVTAGDCYIVLGMSRRWVETCVGLAFKELAAESPDEGAASNDAAPVLVPPGQQASPLPPLRAPVPGEAHQHRGPDPARGRCRGRFALGPTARGGSYAARARRTVAACQGKRVGAAASTRRDRRRRRMARDDAA